MITNIFSPPQSNELTVIATFHESITTTQYGMKSITFGWNGSPKEIDINDCKLIELGVGVQTCNDIESGWPVGYPDAATWWIPCGIYTVLPIYAGQPPAWAFFHPSICKFRNISSWNISWNRVSTYTGLQLPVVNENGITLFAQSSGWYLDMYQGYDVTLYK